MNNRGFICEKTGTKMIAIREEDLDTLLMDLAETTVMVQGLAALIRKEEKLKQHHRPYLDVRKEMIETAEDYLERIGEMDDVIAGMPYGCDLECFQKSQKDFSEFEEDEDEEDEDYGYGEEMDLEHPTNPFSGSMEEKFLKPFSKLCSNGMEMLDDLLTLVEFMEVLSRFMDLMSNGIAVGDAASQTFDCMMDEVEKMVDRWEKYLEISE
jgi:hypothetical protein